MDTKKRHFKCPQCGLSETIKKGTRRGKNRYFCKSCGHWFTIDRTKKDPVLWVPHIDGIPFRKLANEYGLSHAEVYNRVKTEMDALPDCNWLTVNYCNRFCGILVMDGKYVKVKGYKQKIPFIYGIDYLTHDIVISLLAPSENEEAFLKFFRLLKTVKYPLQVVVCDDRSSLIPALKHYFPYSLVQLCQNHYLENIRQTLHIRTEATHQRFFTLLQKRVFAHDVTLRVRNLRLHELYIQTAKNDLVRQAIIVDIYKRRRELFSCTNIPHCPHDTNLIELFNSHLQARLKSIKGFKSFHGAERFLNAYVLRRRTKPFTDCCGQFKHLNQKCSLQMTIKKQTEWSEILALQEPKNER